MQDWRVQYGDLSKNKITVADWAKCGEVIFKLTSYLEIVSSWEHELSEAYKKAEEKGFDESDPSQMFLGSTYTQVHN